MNARSNSSDAMSAREFAGMKSDRPAQAGETAALLRILQLEANIRRLPSERELIYHAANESRNVLGFRQAFVFGKKHKWTLRAVSSVSGFDKQAPLNRQITQFIRQLDANGLIDEVRSVAFDKEQGLDDLSDHVFRNGCWIPFKTRRGKVFGGMLILSEKQWPESFIPLASRVGDSYAFAWQALAGRALERARWFPARLVLPLIVVVLILAGFVPAPLTVLAPVEVTGQNRITVATPLNGVVEWVAINPNTPVAVGSLLVRFEDTELRNAVEISSRKVAIARSEFERLQNSAFIDRDVARDLKVAEAKLELARAELELETELLSRVEVLAPMAGIAIFEDARELTGKPMAIGERLMEIVDPSVLDFTIRLPVDDSIVLTEGARVRVFLDSDPLAPVEASLVRSSYRATSHEDGSFAYTLRAQADNEPLEGLRIGAQGTAQVFGDRYPIHFIVFRRPLSWLRQTLGI